MGLGLVLFLVDISDMGYVHPRKDSTYVLYWQLGVLTDATNRNRVFQKIENSVFSLVPADLTPIS
jgi:hypothetical protein